VCRETGNSCFNNLKKYLDQFPLSHGKKLQCYRIYNWINTNINIIGIRGDAIDSEASPHSSGLHEINSKTVASAFWTHQLEAELRECGTEGYLFENGGSREECMDEIDAGRAKTAYSHTSEDCSDECRRRGEPV
jgi:hypothetical protein